MFAARGIVVSLAFFAMVYCPLSLLVVLAWRGVLRASRSSTLKSANFLFGLRIFSFVASAVVALFFTFPSFWLMERASLDEDGATFVLAACSLMILTAGLFRAFRAQAKTKRAVRQWLSDRSSFRDETAEPTLRASNGAPALILVGVRRPKVMLSDMATLLLSEEELRVAVRHELGHMRSWDNLKKVFISATPFPGMSSLDDAWRGAAELAADDAAVANRENALDLAAALIKLSRASKQWFEPALASGLVSGSSSINLRIERLLEWRGESPRVRRSWPGILFLFLLVAGVATNYGAILVLTHRLTEMLVP
jgi:Zn-dependent protease with chaperone function